MQGSECVASYVRTTPRVAFRRHPRHKRSQMRKIEGEGWVAPEFEAPPRRHPAATHSHRRRSAPGAVCRPRVVPARGWRVRPSVDTERIASHVQLVNLALKALISRLDAAARVQGITDFRVLYRRNKRGELVVALLITDPTGPFSKDTLGE
jgi:hypothetical protein